LLTQTVSDYASIPGSFSPVKAQPFGQSLAPKPLIFYIVESHERPVNVLDIGFGAGGLGRMIRQNSSSAHWSVDGVDGFLPNCLNQTLIGEKVYRHLWHGDVRKVGSDFLSRYDVICLLDVIEHLDVDSAKFVLRALLNGLRDDASLFVSTPLYFMPQDSFQEGDLEEHLICVPATSVMGLLPTWICLNEPLIAGFSLTRRSLETIDLFQPISNKTFSYELGKRVLERCGIPYSPLKVFKL